MFDVDLAIKLYLFWECNVMITFQTLNRITTTYCLDCECCEFTLYEDSKNFVYHQNENVYSGWRTIKRNEQCLQFA